MNKKLRCGIFLLAGAMPYNYLVYCGGRWIAEDLPHYHFASFPDDRIPFLSWTVLIYWGAILFWCMNYIMGTFFDESGYNRFILTHYIGETICFLFFVLLPTAMDRPIVGGDALFERIVRLTYRYDSPDNLFPSIHCFVSWLCVIGVRKNRRIPELYQKFSVFAATAVCISTLTVKQHVIVDAAAGVLLAELSYALAGGVRKWMLR